MYMVWGGLGALTCAGLYYVVSSRSALAAIERTRASVRDKKRALRSDRSEVSDVDNAKRPRKRDFGRR